YFRKMDLEKSMDYYLQSLRYYEEVGNENVVANLFSNIAVTYTALRNYPKALEFLQKAEKYFEEKEIGSELANTQLSLGKAYGSSKDTTGGIEYYHRTIETSKSSGNFAAEATAYNNLGSILTEQGRHREAIDFINKALEIRQNQKLESDAASANMTLGINYLQLRDYQRAKDLLLGSLKHFEANGFNEKIGVSYFQLIAAYAGLHKMDSVFHYMNLYVKNASEILDERVIQVSN